ncbi:MAG: 50S ribosomal protein L9 [Deltaproteobacteria bacterium]|nr:50S ribosomal protein L9 [Deltaproteobacteria bacterium]
MEIILLENMEDLGTVGQTVRVKPGYARNYLLPRKLACVANEKNLNHYRTLIEAKQKKLAHEKASAEKQAEQLSGLTLVFERKTRGEEAKLFGSVTNSDIASALADKGYEIERKRIILEEPIKRLGEYKAMVRLHPSVTATLNVVVKSEHEGEDVG